MLKSMLVGSFALLALTMVPTGDPDAASLGGRVTGETQVAVRDASVSARNIFSGDTQAVRSDEAGWYKLNGLRQGRYSVFVEAEGYSSKQIFNVFLMRGQHTHLDVTLTRGSKAPPTD